MDHGWAKAELNTSTCCNHICLPNGRIKPVLSSRPVDWGGLDARKIMAATQLITLVDPAASSVQPCNSSWHIIDWRQTTKETASC
jgi:hypothetical protein